MRPSGPPPLHLVSRLRHSRRLPAFSTTRCLGILSRPPIGSASSLRRRTLATESPNLPPVHPNRPSPPPPPPQDEEPYVGPLTTTFRRLKILSLSSLTLTFALTPFIFVLETTSSVPLAGRFALAGIAMATSGISTALVAWCGRPYVTTMRWLPAPAGAQAAGSGRAVEMTTLTLGLHRRVTTVYDTAFLVPTSRPFATWELAEAFRLPDAEVEGARAEGLVPGQETIAETRTKDGGLVGSWVVTWDENGVGTCKEVGQVARYFNVHKELLTRPIRYQ